MNLSSPELFLSIWQVRDLARLSLQNPEYLAVHAEAGAPTPAKLQQV